ncbi:MAG: PEP-CTERM sorting domain-containing protein [Lacipirellulaceae bacterium]
MTPSARAILATLVVLTAAPIASAQTETYGWDGSSSTDWSTSTNWFDTTTLVDPVSPLVPGNGTRVEVSVSGANAPVMDSESAQAHQVRLGRATGAGELTISGGSLTTSSTGTVFRVGNGAPGTLNVNGGVVNTPGGTMTTGDGGNWKGQINVTSGAINITGADRDLNMDEFAASTAASNLNISGGSISIADVLLIDNLASIDMSGGTITSAATQAGGTRIRRGGEVRITGGLFLTRDDLELGTSTIAGGSLLIDGGIARALTLSSTGATAQIAVNGTGLLQFSNALQSVAAIEGLISSGLIVSNSLLLVSIVDVAGAPYTQVSVVPEPTSFAIVALGASIAFAARRR